MKIIAAQPKLRPQDVDRNYRQSAVAILGIIHESKIRILPDLPKAQPIGRRGAERSFNALMARLVCVKGCCGNVRPDCKLEHLPFDIGAINRHIPAYPSQFPARAKLRRPCGLFTHRNKGGNLCQFNKGREFGGFAVIRKKLDFSCRFPKHTHFW